MSTVIEGEITFGCKAESPFAQARTTVLPAIVFGSIVQSQNAYPARGGRSVLVSDVRSGEVNEANRILLGLFKFEKSLHWCKTPFQSADLLNAFRAAPDAF